MKMIIFAVLISIFGSTGFSQSGSSIYQLKSQWTRQDGKEVRLNSFKGFYVVTAMIYTTCQDECPLIVADIKKIEKSIPPAQKDKVRFALFSIDPARDNLTKLRKYASAHALNLKTWSLYRASDANVRELAMVLGVKYKKAPDGDFEHSNIITLLSPNGQILAQLSGLRQDPSPLLAKIR